LTANFAQTGCHLAAKIKREGKSPKSVEVFYSQRFCYRVFEGCWARGVVANFSGALHSRIACHVCMRALVLLCCVSCVCAFAVCLYACYVCARSLVCCISCARSSTFCARALYACFCALMMQFLLIFVCSSVASFMHAGFVFMCVRPMCVCELFLFYIPCARSCSVCAHALCVVL
jgi:hypothetical protein